MREHVQVKCSCNKVGCMFCDGGLYACSICGTLEGAVPSECPGALCTQEQIDAIYAGTLDYVNGAWQLSCSPASPAFHRKDPK